MGSALQIGSLIVCLPFLVLAGCGGSPSDIDVQGASPPAHDANHSATRLPANGGSTPAATTNAANDDSASLPVAPPARHDGEHSSPATGPESSAPQSDSATTKVADDPRIKSEPPASESAVPVESAPAASHIRVPPRRPGDWPQFRGADGQGHGPPGKLPLRWNEKKNVTWKVSVPGFGWSSPVIADDRIWLTTAVIPEKSLRVLCLDAATGATLHDVEVFRKESLGTIHPKNSHATPTPVLVGDRCYVHFGSHGTAALDTQGEILWRTELKYYHHHGPGASPVIVDGAAIIACDGFVRPFYDERTIAGVTDPQFVVALESSTGEVRWRARRDGAHSYCTPLVIEVDGQTQIVSPGGNRVTAYDPSTGAEIWTCRYQGYSVVPRPVSGHGLVFVCTGYDLPSLLAIRPDGHGDVTETHVAWKTNQSAPLNPSPILIGDELYTVSDQGVASCLDARTGKVHWRRRLGGNHSASPLFGDGRLYILDEAGTTHVLAPGTKCRILAKNLLRGKTLASLSAGGRALYLRSESHLYRIEDAGAQSADDGEPQPAAEGDSPNADRASEN